MAGGDSLGGKQVKPGASRRSPADECVQSHRVDHAGPPMLLMQRVPVWTRRWEDIPQPSDEYALHAALRYTAPSRT